MTKWDLVVYSYVPKIAKDEIFSYGLYGGKALLQRPDLLKMVAQSKNQSSNKLIKEITDNLKSENKETSLGPNVVFQLIPKNLKLLPNHPTKKFNLISITINLSKLLTDYPETKIFGLELIPYSEKVNVKDRYHYLNLQELLKFLSMSASEIWNTYNDLEEKGLYAPDVPHAVIITPNGIIEPQYLERLSKNSTLIDEYSQAIINYSKLY